MPLTFQVPIFTTSDCVALLARLRDRCGDPADLARDGPEPPLRRRRLLAPTATRGRCPRATQLGDRRGCDCRRSAIRGATPSATAITSLPRPSTGSAGIHANSGAPSSSAPSGRRSCGIASRLTSSLIPPPSSTTTWTADRDPREQPAVLPNATSAAGAPRVSIVADSDRAASGWTSGVNASPRPDRHAERGWRRAATP